LDIDAYRITNAPCDPKPVQSPLPLLVGGRGERRTMRIAARYADEWNAWTTPDEFRQKIDVLERHCDDLGRDPSSIRRSTQALMYLSTDETWLARFRDRDPVRPVIVGTPAEVVEQVAAYRDAGVDELIVPDWTMGKPPRAIDTLELFRTEVVPAVT
jgi:alkanesulfonate monooxygenase SsuD/methylene tetrahydromethanopterin reductase-like flavin-dependent oxidoreductase (luciferase family)